MRYKRSETQYTAKALKRLILKAVNIKAVNICTLVFAMGGGGRRP